MKVDCRNVVSARFVFILFLICRAKRKRAAFLINLEGGVTMNVAIKTELFLIPTQFEFGRWKIQLARFISRASAPPFVTFLTAAVVVNGDVNLPSWRPLMTYGFLAILGPVMLLIALWAKGYVCDFDLTRRSERAMPLISAATGSLLAWGLLRNSVPNSELIRFVGAQTICLALLTVVSLFWKISIHASAAAVLVTVVIIQYGAASSGILLGLGVIGWARIALGKHTIMQFIAGCGLGPLTVAVSRFL